MRPNCFSVIIAGGKGTRFWPLSRAQRPKQLLKIIGRKSLIEATADRVRQVSGSSQTLVVTVADQLRALRRALPDLPPKNFIAEPEGRNTAPCIGLAALEIVARDPGAVMIVLPADHWVGDSAGFRRTLREAARMAMEHDRLVTIGIRPEYPETGYGYILKGKPIAGPFPARGFMVQRFTEKPKLALARRLVRRGSLWNSGIFVWKAATLLELLGRYQPEISAALERIKRAAAGASLARPGAKLRSVIAREYTKMPNLSIDYALMEKAGTDGKVLTLEAAFGWSDVGSWAAVHRLLQKDRVGIAGEGRWLALHSRNSLIHANDRLVVILGIQNALIVDTADALLVADLSRSQEVRDIVDELKHRGLGAYTV
jgi:mannose-1-phosphate guanylyltransferase